MKTKTFLFVVLLIIIILLISLQLFQSKTGPNDGIVKPAGKKYNIEMKNRHPYIYAFLLDNKFKTLSNVGLLCEASLMFPDSTSIKTTLEPYDEYGFFIKVSQYKFSTCRIYFNVYGETVTAEFENESIAVNNK